MKIQRRSLFLFPLACVLLLFFYAFEILSHPPFLQHEMVGQAFWFTQDRISFLKLIFDSVRMDCHPGRFRYLEWLLQAGYWKAMANGWLPRDLYDFVAFLVTPLSGILLFKIGKRRGLGKWEVLLLVGLFFLSSQVYLIHLFNFRKAKFLTSFLFLFYIWVAGKPLSDKKNHLLWFLLPLVGFLVDVYFILMGLLVAVAVDLEKKDKTFRQARGMFLGFVLAGIFTLYLANVIGPVFSENSRIRFGAIEGTPTTFLKLSNLPYFAHILPDLISPYLFQSHFTLLAWASFLLFAGLWFFLCRKEKFPPAYLTLFLISLPVGAFCLLPKREYAYFSGYYGHTFLVFMLLALIEILLFLRSLEKTWPLKLGYGVIVCLLCFHEIGKPASLNNWVTVYSTSTSSRAKYFSDYALIREVGKQLASSSRQVVVPLDLHNVNYLALSMGSHFDYGGKTRHTDLAYILLPAIFKKEFDEGRIRIVKGNI